MAEVCGMNINQNVLEVKGVDKNFGGVQALKNAHFELVTGEVHALMGENGAGKSTMMNIIGGLLRPDSGEIFISGEAVNLYSSRDAQDKGITFIHQELTLFPDLDVMSNIFIEEFASKNYASFIKSSPFYKKAKEILDTIELAISPYAKIRDLSMGERQMIEISRMFIRETKILVLDEPTSSLTDKEVTVLFKLIRKMTGLGVSVIYISHKLEEIFQISDRITVLRDGESVGTFRSKDIDQKTLIKHMIGRGMDEKYPLKTHIVREEDILEVYGLRNSRLEDLTFSVKKGEVLGFVGLLGSGRTELAKAIFGLDEVKCKCIKINGKEAGICSPKHAIGHGIGFVTENRREEGLILEKTIKENIVLANLKKYVRQLIFMNEKRQEHEVDHSIRQLAVKTSSSKQLVKNLSGGNQQKVVIAKWLLTKPSILILDEPTRGIDVGAKHEIYKLVDQLAEQGVGIIYISSEIPEVLGVCDSVIVMRKGKIVRKLDISEASQERIMNLAQGGVDSE